MFCFLFSVKAGGRNSTAVLVVALVAVSTLFVIDAERGNEKTREQPKVTPWSASSSFMMQQEDMALREQAANYRAAALRASRLAAEFSGAELAGVPTYELPVWPDAYRSRPSPFTGSAFAELSPWQPTLRDVQAVKESAHASVDVRADDEDAIEAAARVKTAKKFENYQKTADGAASMAASDSSAELKFNSSVEEVTRQLNRSVQAALVELHDSEARALQTTQATNNASEDSSIARRDDWKRIVDSASTLRRSIEHRIQVSAARAHKAEENYGASYDVLQKGIENLEATIRKLRIKVPEEHMAYVSDIKSAMHLGSKRSLIEMDAKAHTLQRAVKTLNEESEMQANEFEA